jgi:radical SAM protein (TIGR01212 family)
VSAQVRDGIDYLKKRYHAEKFIVYFQPYTNTHAPLGSLIPLYQEAIAHPDVIGLSVGTRPDCVDEGKIAWFESLARTHFVTLEYGLQSSHDETLARINRGHDYQCWLDAMDQTRNRGIWLGTHLILGFPWESREEMLETAEAVSAKGVNFLKLHHFHVVRDTAIGVEYRRNPFPLLKLEDYAELVVDFLERLSPSVYVERLFGWASMEQLIGPVWGISKSEIKRYVEQRLAERNTCQGRLAGSGQSLGNAESGAGRCCSLTESAKQGVP